MPWEWIAESTSRLRFRRAMTPCTAAVGVRSQRSLSNRCNIIVFPAARQVSKVTGGAGCRRKQCGQTVAVVVQTRSIMAGAQSCPPPIRRRRYVAAVRTLRRRTPAAILRTQPSAPIPRALRFTDTARARTVFGVSQRDDRATSWRRTRQQRQHTLQHPVVGWHHAKMRQQSLTWPPR